MNRTERALLQTAIELLSWADGRNDSCRRVMRQYLLGSEMYDDGSDSLDLIPMGEAIDAVWERLSDVLSESAVREVIRVANKVRKEA